MLLPRKAHYAVPPPKFYSRSSDSTILTYIHNHLRDSLGSSQTLEGREGNWGDEKSEQVRVDNV
jgi:hypothetical protein